jgi:hypothetical protein
MTFSYSPFTANKDRVRFHIGDTDSTQAWFSDEELTAIITEAGSWQLAVIACLKNMYVRLSSEPTMRADWLQTDYATALKGLDNLIKSKANEFGVAAGRVVTASVVQTYRPDSNQTAEIDYDA